MAADDERARGKKRKKPGPMQRMAAAAAAAEHLARVVPAAEHLVGATAPRAAPQPPAAAAPPPAAPPPPAAGGAARAGRPWTLSVALPGSILLNAQTRELRTHLAAQVARALAIFNVDEVIIFETPAAASAAAVEPRGRGADGGGGGAAPTADGAQAAVAAACAQLARLLEYAECPQYLRKALFPLSPELRLAGLMAPLDMPHHMRAHDRSLPYREGVTLRPAAAASPADAPSAADVGLRAPVRLDRTLVPGVRVTVRMPTAVGTHARVVAPSEPREAQGVYWGYRTRVAASLERAWAEGPFGAAAAAPRGGGYDLVLGTSENGASGLLDDRKWKLPRFRHCLVVFGGVEGLEAVVREDASLGVPPERTAELFDLYLNVCPSQGSRTIRTEEAMLIALSALRPRLERNRVPKGGAAAP